MAEHETRSLVSPRALLNNLPGMVFRFSHGEKGWIIDYVSDGALRLTEYPPDHFIGKPIEIFDNIVHNLDRPKIKKIFKKTYETMATSYTMEYRIHTKSGKIKWVSEHGTCRYSPYGAITSEEGYSADITEHKRIVQILKESENRFRSVAQSAKEAILSFDDDGRIVFWNKGAETIFGYAEGEVWGTQVERLIPQRHLEDHRAVVRKLRLGQPLEKTIEGHALRKDGSEFPVELSVSTWIGKKQPFYTAILRDVAARRQMEETLRASEEEARKAYDELNYIQGELIRTEKSRALGEMAAGVAHQFNNILMMISGQAELCLTHMEDREKVIQHLNKIKMTGEDGANIVRRIQTFARRTQNTEMKPIHINECIVASIQLTRPKWKGEMEKSGRTVTVRSDLAEVPPVLGVESELREVLVNLIMNAVDAMPDGGALTIATHQQAENILIRIKDSGIGIPREIQEKIFLPFFSTKVDRGTGLGLSICQNIVTQMRGTITVESEPGNGATFTITLPAMPASSDTRSRKEETDVRNAPPQARILVVDDEETICEILEGFLSPQGHRVTTVSNPRQAIDIFMQQPFDLVISDLGMAPITGWEVLTEIRKAYPNIKTILLTGWGNTIDPADARTKGADVVLTKPIELRDLLKAVNELLSTSRDG